MMTTSGARVHTHCHSRCSGSRTRKATVTRARTANAMLMMYVPREDCLEAASTGTKSNAGTVAAAEEAMVHRLKAPWSGRDAIVEDTRQAAE